MNTSSVKIETINVESFDILELVGKDPEVLMQMLQGTNELHISVTHRDLLTVSRSMMVTDGFKDILKGIVLLAQRDYKADYETLLMINQGVSGYFEESLNQFKDIPPGRFVQMDIRLMTVRNEEGFFNINTKTSFLDANGNYKSLNQNA